MLSDVPNLFYVIGLPILLLLALVILGFGLYRAIERAWHG